MHELTLNASTYFPSLISSKPFATSELMWFISGMVANPMLNNSGPYPEEILLKKETKSTTFSLSFPYSLSLFLFFSLPPPLSASLSLSLALLRTCPGSVKASPRAAPTRFIFILAVGFAV